MIVERITGLLQEIRRRRETFDPRDYLLHEPKALFHWAVQIEWVPGHGYTVVLTTTTENATEYEIAIEAAQRGVIPADDVAFVKQVRRISPQEAKLWQNR